MTHALKGSLKKAFDRFLNSNLCDEIRNCQSGQDFNTLIHHLEYFGWTFDVDRPAGWPITPISASA